ncbi:MAG: hypothetical protein SCK28_04520 [Bacillota bacterium]|nr:hypothetical protein [Bacillota bacterium]
MPWKEGLEIINNAFEQKEKDKAWQMWLAIYPHMVVPQPLSQSPALKFKPFSKFYEQQKNPVVKSKMSKEEIIDKYTKLKDVHQKRQQRP